MIPSHNTTSASPRNTSPEPARMARGNLEKHVEWILSESYDPNQRIAWPGRLDPCNMSNDLPRLLQTHVEQMALPLTPEQQKLARYDLAMIALRGLCENHVGEGHEFAINLDGKTFALDAVDLTRLLQEVPEGGLTPQAFDRAVQQRSMAASLPEPIVLKNPDPFSMTASITEAGRENIHPDYQLRGPLYQEMVELLQRSPIRAFDTQKQEFAKQVIDRLPQTAQGELHGVPARLIGMNSYLNVMKAAALHDQLPQPLMAFFESCEFDSALNKAFYKNPCIAARILGLPQAPAGSGLSNDSVAGAVVGQLVGSEWPRVGFMPRAMKLGKLTTKPLAKETFSKLARYEGFGLQDMAAVPSCFPDIKCPNASAVQLAVVEGRNRPLPIHANHVSMGQGRQAIAAMQPVHDAADLQSSNLAAFYHLLAHQPNTTVVDLRSRTDFRNGSFNYCPDVGKREVIRNPENGVDIQITTLGIQQLPQASSQEVTLRIQVGQQPPRDVKVVQFREWPDHGVITSAQLRQLRQVASNVLSNKGELITHCRAGVGRTGTLLAYENLYHSLIEQGKGRDLVNAQGMVDRQKLLQAVTKVVVQGRIERGPYFVQAPEQFTLLCTTLKADLKAHASTLHSRKTAEPAPTVPKSASKSAKKSRAAPIVGVAYNNITKQVKLPGKQIGLNNNPASNLVPEPASKPIFLQHWSTILEKGEDVVEIISDPQRLVGAKNSAHVGLGHIAQQHGMTVDDLQLGKNRVLSITPLKITKQNQDGQLIHAQKFQISYQALGADQVKTLVYTQLLTPFDGKQLTAKQINDMLIQLNPAGQTQSQWMTSVKGVGRPSALLVAQAMRNAIQTGAIDNQKTLLDSLDKWIDFGRAELGPLFINSSEQKKQLIELGTAWLTNQALGNEMTQNIPESAEDVRRAKYFKSLEIGRPGQ